MLAFHAYPSTVQTFASYDRSQPLACDTVEFDTTTWFDPVQYCFVAKAPCILRATANILWHEPPENAGLTLLFIKNTLPPPGGSTGGEIAGDDVIARGQARNQSCRLSRLLKLDTGDRLWAVPCIDAGGSLTIAYGGDVGYNTVNYFEGMILDLL